MSPDTLGYLGGNCHHARARLCPRWAAWCHRCFHFICKYPFRLSECNNSAIAYSYALRTKAAEHTSHFFTCSAVWSYRNTTPNPAVGNINVSSWTVKSFYMVKGHQIKWPSCRVLTLQQVWDFFLGVSIIPFCERGGEGRLVAPCLPPFLYRRHRVGTVRRKCCSLGGRCNRRLRNVWQSRTQGAAFYHRFRFICDTMHHLAPFVFFYQTLLLLLICWLCCVWSPSAKVFSVPSQIIFSALTCGEQTHRCAHYNMYDALPPHYSLIDHWRYRDGLKRPLVLFRSISMHAPSLWQTENHRPKSTLENFLSMISYLKDPTFTQYHRLSNHPVSVTTTYLKLFSNSIPYPHMCSCIHFVQLPLWHF